jgi:YD repeat-containing protein
MKGFSVCKITNLPSRVDYRLTAQTTLPFQNLSYTWDGADNITALTSLGSLGSTQNFGYDALHRLWTAEASPYGGLSYDYDALGNRLTETKNGELASYQYPPESHRLGSITGSVSQHFLYDENGNTVDNSRFGFVYRQNNCLRIVTSGGATVAEYRYNGRGELYFSGDTILISWLQ